MTGHQRERKAELKDRFAALLGPVATSPTQVEPAPSQPAPAQPTAAEPPAAPPPTAKKPTRTSSSRPRAEQPAPMPFAQENDATRPKRLMVPLSVDEDRALKELRLADGVPAAARVRAMLQVYRQDERFRRRVDEAAQRMR